MQNFILTYPAGTRVGSFFSTGQASIGGSGGNPGPSPAGPGERVYANAGGYSLDVPPGVEAVLIECWGAGAGGGGNSAAPGTSPHGGGGGGSGGYAAGELGAGLIVPGSTLTLVVGNRGLGGPPGNDGQVGGPSRVEVLGTEYIRAGGGAGGISGPSGGAGGAGGTNTFDPAVTELVVDTSGGAGGSVPGASTVGGTGGESPGGGAGGAGGAINTAGSVGTAPGGGGGGAGATTVGGGNKSGAIGAVGKIRVSWPP